MVLLCFVLKEEDAFTIERILHLTKSSLLQKILLWIFAIFLKILGIGVPLLVQIVYIRFYQFYHGSREIFLLVSMLMIMHRCIAPLLYKNCWCARRRCKIFLVSI